VPSSYTLGGHFEAFVKAQLASGRYRIEGNRVLILRILHGARGYAPLVFPAT
jgi:plasmid stabilization system protein ParE